MGTVLALHIDIPCTLGLTSEHYWLWPKKTNGVDIHLSVDVSC